MEALRRNPGRPARNQTLCSPRRLLSQSWSIISQNALSSGCCWRAAFGSGSFPDLEPESAEGIGGGFSFGFTGGFEMVSSPPFASQRKSTIDFSSSNIPEADCGGLAGFLAPAAGVAGFKGALGELLFEFIVEGFGLGEPPPGFAVRDCASHRTHWPRESSGSPH